MNLRFYLATSTPALRDVFGDSQKFGWSPARAESQNPC